MDENEPPLQSIKAISDRDKSDIHGYIYREWDSNIRWQLPVRSYHAGNPMWAGLYHKLDLLVLAGEVK